MNTPRVEIRRKPLSFWTEENKTTAKRMYVEEDKSAAIVGAHLGVSRNAVIGIINRMGLKKDKPPLVREPRQRIKPIYKRARTAADRVQRRAEGPVPQLIRGEDIPPLLASVRDLNDTLCAYPYGIRDYQFCGRPRVHGSFCDQHGAICYNEPRIPIAKFAR